MIDPRRNDVAGIGIDLRRGTVRQRARLKADSSDGAAIINGVAHDGFLSRNVEFPLFSLRIKRQGQVNVSVSVEDHLGPGVEFETLWHFCRQPKAIHGAAPYPESVRRYGVNLKLRRITVGH